MRFASLYKLKHIPDVPFYSKYGPHIGSHVPQTQTSPTTCIVVSGLSFQLRQLCGGSGLCAGQLSLRDIWPMSLLLIVTL